MMNCNQVGDGARLVMMNHGGQMRNRTEHGRKHTLPTITGTDCPNNWETSAPLTTPYSRVRSILSLYLFISVIIGTNWLSTVLPSR